MLKVRKCVVVPFKCHSVTQTCSYFTEGLRSFFVTQSFRALGELIMTHVHGRGYFQHANTITRKQYSTNVLWLHECVRACVHVNSSVQDKVSKEQTQLLVGNETVNKLGGKVQAKIP